MRSVTLTCLLALGCRFSPGDVAAGDGGGAADATSSDGIDDAAGFDLGPADAFVSDWPATNVDPADPSLPAPSGALDLTGVHTYDTTDGTLSGLTDPASLRVMQGGGPDVRVVVLDGLTLASTATLEIVGLYPVIIVVHGDAQIDGTIRVTAGQNPLAPCGSGVGANGDSSAGPDGGGGGGGGAGYGAAGGDGSDGSNGGDGPGQGGANGMQEDNDQLSPLRPGCSGGDGGPCNITSGGAGGAGGGALEISVRGRLLVAGQIAAPGAGGQGGFGTAGNGGSAGGGGGSGGAILLEANPLELTASAALCANGGSGGEGGDGAAADGRAGLCADDPATTPNMFSSQGEGGDGGYRSTPSGQPGGDASIGSGGGGGGGGVGRIRLRNHSGGSPTGVEAALVSPDPRVN